MKPRHRHTRLAVSNSYEEDIKHARGSSSGAARRDSNQLALGALSRGSPYLMKLAIKMPIFGCRSPLSRSSASIPCFYDTTS